MDRVRQGIAALAIIAGLSSGCASMRSQPAATGGPAFAAAERLEESLSENPYVEHITRCDTPGATRLLAVVGQRHYIEPPRIDDAQPDAMRLREIGKRRYAQVNAYQCSIYEVLQGAMTTAGTRTVLLEGLSHIPHPTDLLREYYRILSTLEREGYVTPAVPLEKNMTYGDVEKELHSRYPPTAPDWGSYACIPGASYLLALQGRADIFPAETPQSEARAHAGAKAARLRGDPRPWDDVAVIDDREDAALLRASQVAGPVALLVFGAGHAFGGQSSCDESYPMTGRISYRDNIAQWNATHDEKFSLLEITVRDATRVLPDPGR